MKKISAVRFFALSSLCLFLLCLFSLNAQITQAQTVVNFETNVGDIEVTLFDDTATTTVNNFLGYVQRGDYDSSIFHRSILAPGDLSIIQGGVLLDDGSVIERQPPIPDEFGASNIRGTIAMARTGDPNSATSSFFFNTDDNSNNLDSQNGGFTTFGIVTSGLEVMDLIQSFQTSNGDGDPDMDSNFDFFTDIPVMDLNADPVTAPSNLVVVNRITVTSAVPEPTATVALAIGGVFAATRRRRR